MSSFFEKLKKGMEIEGPDGTTLEEEIEKKSPKEEKFPTGQVKPSKVRKIKKIEIKAGQEKEAEEIEEPEIEEKASLVKTVEEKEKWFETEGELAIDVYQTETELVIRSAIAGVKPENLDISVEGDIITIKGSREKPEEGGTYFTQECYWGPFSRKVILPAEIDPNRIEATMKEGILTIRMLKIERERKRRIIVGN